jgi:hypothetical protein
MIISRYPMYPSASGFSCTFLKAGMRSSIRETIKFTIFSPTMAVAEDLKLLAVQGVKGMGDRENSFR